MVEVADPMNSNPVKVTVGEQKIRIMGPFQFGAWILICADCNAQYESYAPLDSRELADGTVCLSCPCGRDLAMVRMDGC
jgi:hypothetical protein